MPHQTCHTEVSNKERNASTHDGDDGGQVSQSKAVEDTSDRGLVLGFRNFASSWTNVPLQQDDGT